MRSLLTLLLFVSLSAAAQQPDSPQLKERDVSSQPAKQVVMINGRPYQRPTQKQLFVDYLRDSYGLPAFARSGVRTLYNFGLDQPHQWGQDFLGFM